MNHLQVISDHLAPALLVVFRIGGLMVYGPVFGSSVVPARLKVFLAFILGLAVYPLLSRQYLGDQALALDLWSLGPLVATELLVGMVVGFVASLPMVAVQTGGLMMGQQMGLGFARFYNPAIDDQADIIGQMLFFLALALFLSIGGHEAMVLAVLNSFQHIPLGHFAAEADLVALLTGMLLAAFEIALRVAAPLLALIFLESLAMGFIAKTVPQLNILSLGFPLRIIAGFALVSFGVVIISEVMMEGIDQALAALFAWVESH
ncbi:MAG: flagellar biosynthetic protein FliR [Phycisphaerales bacterium]|nr:MAG: flagellar biosynthetic protein FliR [Phycisphaerales bacterium]